MLAAADVEHIAAVAFADIAVIVVVARLMGSLFRRIGQPAVVGEILAGIALGPSLLGALPGDLTDRIFPLEVRPFLAVIAQLGLVMFMFVVGLELDPKLVRGKERVAAVVSLSSVLVPFASGFGAAALLFGAHDAAGGEEVDFVAFALFLGASMSVTAFPVLARILTERGMHRTQLGALVLACAAVDDVLAWSLLAVVVAVAASASAIDVPLVMVEAVAFVAVMFLVVRPQLARLADRYRERGQLTAEMVAVVLVGILVSSYLTSVIGIHAIFGAFVFGVVMPREDTVEMFHDLLGRFEQLVVLLLLPVFFIVTGLSVDIRGLGLANVPELGLIIGVACLGKFAGAALAGRALGMRSRRAASIGILMNTRGLTELVILSIGLELGVLDQQMFTMLVVMAVFTTVITTPLLRVVYPDRLVARDVAEAEGTSDTDAFRVVVSLGGGGDDLTLARFGSRTAGGEQPAELVLTRLLPSHGHAGVASGVGVDLAAMTDTIAALRALAEQVGGAAHVAVRAQFADDRVTELRAQVAASAAQSIVVGRDDAVVPDLVARAPCVVVAVAEPLPSVPGPVVAIVDDIRAGMAAVEVAIRLALADGSPVVLVPGASRRASRRAAALASSLAATSIPTSVAEAAPADGLVVAPRGDAAPTVHAVVAAPADHPTDCVEHLLDRLVAAEQADPPTTEPSAEHRPDDPDAHRPALT